jgi:hypothetical protein
MPSSSLSLAAVTQSAPNKPPTLSPGTLTPAIIMDWEAACNSYFIHKEVEETNQVKHVVGGLQDPIIWAWYLEDRTRINTLKFPAFLVELRKNNLPKFWEQDEREKVLSSHQGSTTFFDWQTSLRSHNANLVGTTSHFSASQLRKQLEANMSDDLKRELREDPIDSKLSLQDWVWEVKTRDEKLRHEHDRILAIMQLDRAKRQADRGSTTTVTTTHATAHTPVTTTNNTLCLPKLTERERMLLSQHQGCFKCRRFYAGHSAST